MLKYLTFTALAATLLLSTGCHAYPRTGLRPEASDPAIWREAIRQADAQISGAGIDYRVREKERRHGIIP